MCIYGLIRALRVYSPQGMSGQSGVSWPSGLVHWTQVLVLSECAWVRIPAWPVAALVSLSKTLNHNCFVLRMGRKAVGSVCCVMHVKEPRTLIVKEKGLAPVFLDSRLEHPAGWICARYKSSALLVLLVPPSKLDTELRHCCPGVQPLVTLPQPLSSHINPRGQTEAGRENGLVPCMHWELASLYNRTRVQGIWQR